VFGDEKITLARVAEVIAAFERTIVPPLTAWDRFQQGETSALTAEQEQGRALFYGKAQCSTCHNGPDLGGDEFVNTGVPQHPTRPDVGRFAVTKRAADRHAFRVPGLRGLVATAPYMHNGVFATLEEVVEHYDRGGAVVGPRDGRIQSLRLQPEEKVALLAFLRCVGAVTPQ
jgi:cytochrome c peroxidase